MGYQIISTNPSDCPELPALALAVLCDLRDKTTT